MNFTRFACFSRILNRNLSNQYVKQKSFNNSKSSRCLQRAINNEQSNNSHSFSQNVTIVTPIGLLLGFNLFKKAEEEEETPEDKLIMTIKRSILSIQRKEYDKAEQMLHLALRMAQDMQHKDGVTYVYDVLANLAMERGHFQKAEKLFKDVMQRLFASGETEDSCKILHMSSKLAHMAHLQQHYEKALQGFEWTMAKIEENLKKLPDSEDLQYLKAVTSDWYGQLLVEQAKYAEAMKMFKESYRILSARFGEKYEELVPILNNLSVTAIGNDTTQAKQYLTEALEIIKTIPEATMEGVLQANLGLIYLKEGMTEQAKKTCAFAYKLGKKLNDDESFEQAKYCIEEIKKHMSQE